MFIRELIKHNNYKRILIVDDEADITSIGYERIKGQEDISLRRISSAINTMRKQLHSNIEHVLLQVTATPYALYLQPECFTNSNIMPIKPTRTVVIPTGKGYIGGQYYFIESEDETSDNYHKAKYLIHIVDQDEMNIINGTRKNSGKNCVINDKRTVRMHEFIRGQSKRSTFALPSLRNWIFDILVGAAILQLNPGNEDYYVSAVLHATTAIQLHKNEKYLIESAIREIVAVLIEDIDDDDFDYFVKSSYNDIVKSVKAYSVLRIPTFEEVKRKIAAKTEDGNLEGLIMELDIKEVNSDKEDIMILLNNLTGELKLENSITIFVGGQVLDRGITIPNLIGFFYGRDPATMQQDTVMQHCRMFGYRKEELLSVTRFYTTYRLFSNMKEITIRDTILRKRMLQQEAGDVIYLEAGGKIKACSPQKVLASKINSILPEKRYLPIGFDVNKMIAKVNHIKILNMLGSINAILPEEKNVYHKGDSYDDKYVVISSELAIELIRLSYESIEPRDDGICNKFSDFEPTFWFSLSERMKDNTDEIAIIVRRNREISKMKKNETVYQDSPDDGNNEGALAKELRKKMPVLVMTEQTNPEWGAKFWWPVYYTPVDMNVGIYSEELSKTGVAENILSLGIMPITISKFILIDNFGVGEELYNYLDSTINKILEFYKESFFIKDAIKCNKKRKEIECRIYIESDEFNSTSNIKNEILAICKKVEKTLYMSGLDEDIKKEIFDYFKEISEGKATDENREKALEAINHAKFKKMQQNILKQLIDEADELLCRSREFSGYFIPLGSGNCEIRLYYNTIEKEVQENGHIDDTFILVLLANVLAHEIYHALHYADVMTESGRWLYKNKDFFKQGVVQETLAEYFALSYSKNVIVDEAYNHKFIKYIHNIRNKDQFPADGGYSGSIILESCEIDGCCGSENQKYKEVYINSLSDMPYAYVNITK